MTPWERTLKRPGGYSITTWEPPRHSNSRCSMFRAITITQPSGVKAVDRNDPLWNKGLYRHLLGPMHYSWDWGNVHFVALDGTSFPPYEEKLGAEQLAWLKADLSFQPHDKPLVLFCHQPVVATKCLRD